MNQKEESALEKYAVDVTKLSEEGKLISKDCNLCHTINAQGPIENMEYANFNEELEFVHPGGFLEKEDWEDGFCTDCHEGDGP